MTTILVGTLVGALLVSGGLLIGLWIGRHLLKSPTKDAVRTQHVQELLGGISHWTHGFVGEMSQYGMMLKDISERLQSLKTEAPRSSSDPAYRLLQELLHTNDNLQRKLDAAERSLSHKAEEVEAYLSEARTDALTKLPNRRAFDDELGRRFAQWQRSHTPVALLIIDIDHFKSFNDQYGHLVGDAVLQQVGRALHRVARDTDLLCRMGGEEFGVILPSTRLEDACRAAVRFNRAVSHAKIAHEGKEYKVTISVGVAESSSGDDIATLIRRADEAMYSAKQNGRNRAYYHDNRETHFIDEKAIETGVKTLTPTDPIPTRFASVCDDLREKLLQVSQEK